MCPDPQLISTYVDEELPSPWKEKMEKHLAGCPVCKDRYANLKRVRQLFKKNTHERRVYVERALEDRDNADSAFAEHFDEYEYMEKARNRVWANLQSRGRRFSARPNLWRRGIPIPLAAAAAVFVALITFFFVNGTVKRAGSFDFSNNFFIAAEDEIHVHPATDMDSVLQYLETGSNDLIFIQLPETGNFSRTGDPAIIKAADFSPGSR